MDDPIEKHVKSIEWIRDELDDMDNMINPIMGIRDFDDAVCHSFNGKIIASIDGPYDKRLVLKSALVHACTDVIVKGAKPIFALEALYGSMDDVRLMVDKIKIQSVHLNVPVIGGNTKIGVGDPTATFAIFGELLLGEPIRDCTAEKGDKICLIGEPLWGEMQQRLVNAKKMFSAWYELLEKIKITSSKDVTKGGLSAQIYEMEKKSNKSFNVCEIEYPMSKNLDNFLVTLKQKDYPTVSRICEKHDCKLLDIGVVE